jgi:aerobic carbon-monoxide dehydrogenase small subunit
MNAISLTVNGKPVDAEVEPRTHLADFLRDHLHLTGTHIGCEHGVCGACTLLVNGEPARSCITFAANLGGHEICSIESLEDDIVAAALRDAFKAEHALQCGYCTPGMLVTARDIVLRLPYADDDRIRTELAGNLCRCTGYNGIVKAIRRVLDLRLNIAAPAHPVLATMVIPRMQETAPDAHAPVLQVASQSATRPDGNILIQHLRLALSQPVIWEALQDPALIASCVPGARLNSVENGKIAGEMLVSLGPIQGRFAGSAEITYNQTAFSGTVGGEGKDQSTGTRLSAHADFNIAPDGEMATILTLSITYTLRGALAQFARGPVVKALADEIVGLVGRNLQAKLRGEAVYITAPKLNAFRLVGGVILSWFNRILFRRK